MLSLLKKLNDKRKVTRKVTVNSHKRGSRQNEKLNYSSGERQEGTHPRQQINTNWAHALQSRYNEKYARLLPFICGASSAGRTAIQGRGTAGAITHDSECPAHPGCHVLPMPYVNKARPLGNAPAAAPLPARSGGHAASGCLP